MAIKSFKVETGITRILLVLAGVVCLACVFFSIRWFLGNSISSQANSIEVAELAVRMASSDPRPHFALAVLNERTFLPEDLPKSLREYEKAVSLSPNDYRLWLALGKAREQRGDSKRAEFALKKAIELAPNYAQVQWALGNNLLRQGKTEKAFVEIRKAVDQDPKFANPAATTMWQIFDGDIDKVKEIVGNSNHVNSALATFLARQKRFDEAISIWNKLPETEKKKEFKADGENIYKQLLKAKKYQIALAIKSQIAENDDGNFKIGLVNNGGFESRVNTKDPSEFEWRIAKGTKPQINIAGNQKKTGKRSLLLTFNVTKRDDFRDVSQLIAVNSSKDYEFVVFYKSDLDLKETMKWEIVDAGNNSILASSEMIKAKADWTRLAVTFTTGDNTEGVRIRLVRDGCESTVCPLKGRVWFDDFELE